MIFVGMHFNNLCLGDVYKKASQSHIHRKGSVLERIVSLVSVATLVILITKSVLDKTRLTRKLDKMPTKVLASYRNIFQRISGSN